MLNYIEQEHIEVCQLEISNENIIHYQPHHAVKKAKLNKTKFRIVFDASSYDPRMPSLNDTLQVGPNPLPETFGCLLRFRIQEFAITGDVQQAFLRLSLHKKDKDALRFVWYNLLQNKTFPNEITTYRFTHLPFGLACSPFLLCAVTRELASKHMKIFPTAAPMMDKNLYMDDFVASVETEPQIITLHRELTDLMLLIKILMHKWATNSLMLQNLLRI
ncbi:integrase catalytic domain-containing protein [Trichonephila inaurata madagascariensis]|uniref:Integrase catalytic domain-containing protein n=1 Tax=Trichonephila inaurata madagascariensis TaxID=2747483 RepID=A0A8X6JFF2_9ARAC|nr:integrase catalytic domain-containing protein [Trichonephila inaurata madagascariensis]